MLAHRAQEDLLGSLFPSKATLLVVPNTLLDHWDVSIAGGGLFSLSAFFFPALSAFGSDITECFD